MRAFVTGAAAGVGAWSARRLADAGFDVTVADRDPSQIAEELGATGVALDVRDEAQVAAALDGVDVLVNAASAIAPGSVSDTPLEVWLEVMDVNARGTFLCCKHALARMTARGRGTIVNVIGLPPRAHAAYASSQGAVAALTRALAVDHGADGIRVNAVCAGGAPDEDVADAVVYLATAEFVTGAILTIDDGRSVAGLASL